jgi:hypothetical protein
VAGLRIEAVSRMRTRAGRFAVPLWPAAATAFTLAMTSGAFAQGLPGLRGKSVVVNWVDERMQRVVGQQNFVSMRVPQNLSFYHSPAGRVFIRRTATPGRSVGTKETVRSRGGGQGRVVQASGRSLTVITGSGEGAFRVSFEFDASFGSCRASVLWAKPAGAETMRAKVLTGEDMEIRSSTPIGITCAVQSGNVFAQ